MVRLGGSTLNPSELLVHDIDVLSVVNELINAGAEAISINDQRWVSNTAISCRGNTIDINGERIGAPFVMESYWTARIFIRITKTRRILIYTKRGKCRS